MAGIFDSISVLVLLLLVRKIQAAPETQLSLLPSDCGTGIVVDDDKVYTGNEAHVASYPWMAILRYYYGRRFEDSCVGSLINSRYVLTAAQCVKYYEPSKIILGEYDKAHNPDCQSSEIDVESERYCVGPIEEFGIESTIVHPEYSRRKCQHDIGLVRLDREVMMKDHIQPICLPVTSELRNDLAESYVVTTWKIPFAVDEADSVLSKATVRLINSTDCKQRLGKVRRLELLSNLHICSTGSNQICGGSAGAPLGNIVSHNGERFVQYGINSFGITTCGITEIPEVFTKVVSYVDWILDNIAP